MTSSDNNVSMAREWHLYAQEDHFWFRWRFRVFLKFRKLLPGQPFRIFEIGCGTGTFLKQITNNFKCIALGCELDAIENIRKDDAFSVIHYDIFDSRPELSESFDVVFLMDVIEHIDDEKAFIMQSSGFLKPGGLLVINVPALQFLYSKYDNVVGHLRRYNKKRLNKLLETCGFEIVKNEYWGATLIPVAFIRKIYITFIRKENVIEKGFAPPGKLSEKILKFLMRADFICKRHFTGTSLMVAAKKNDKAGASDLQ